MSGSSDFWKNITKPTGTGKLTVEMVNRAWYQILVKDHPDLADDAMRQVYGIDVREDVSDD